MGNDAGLTDRVKILPRRRQRRRKIFVHKTIYFYFFTFSPVFRGRTVEYTKNHNNKKSVTRPNKQIIEIFYL